MSDFVTLSPCQSQTLWHPCKHDHSSSEALGLVQGTSAHRPVRPRPGELRVSRRALRIQIQPLCALRCRMLT